MKLWSILFRHKHGNSYFCVASPSESMASRVVIKKRIKDFTNHLGHGTSGPGESGRLRRGMLYTLNAVL